MATKKSTRSTSTRTRSKRAAASDAASEIRPAETAPAESTTPPATKTRGGAARGTTTRRKRASAADKVEAPAVEMVAETPVAAAPPPPVAKTAEVASSGPTVEKADGMVIIRFAKVETPNPFKKLPAPVKPAPPTAPPPAERAAARAERTPPPAAPAPEPREGRVDDWREDARPAFSEEGADEPRGPRRRRRRGGRRRDGEGTDAAPDAVEPRPEIERRPAPIEGEEQGNGFPPGLSRSQKRRLRRKRRMQGLDGGPGDRFRTPPAPGAAGPAEGAASLPFDGDSEEAEEVESNYEFADEAREAYSPDEGDAGAEPATDAEAPDGARDEPRGRGRRGRRWRGRRNDWSPDADTRAADDGGDELIEIGPDADADQSAVEIEGAPKATGSHKEMIINIAPREECRIAILEGGKLEEIYLERASAENHVGNIYKGVVTNVEPGIQAAFVDFGLGKNGFLHISDLHPEYFPHGEGNTENVGRKLPRRHRPPIQRCLRRGQEVLVQITKEGIGTKGPTLTTYLAVPGRFMVLMPGMRQLGVSRKIEDEDLRRRIKDSLKDLELPEKMGFIARTAAEGRTRRELQSDLNYLSRLWRAVEKRMERDRAPAELYRESDLVIRTIRDAFTKDVERIIVDDAEVAERAKEFLSIFSPRAGDIVQLYQGPTPIFHQYGIEAELERLHSRHVPLRSGGSLVVDQTEALVAIDVNSGRFRAEQDAEETAFKINIEAADEIPRQLRLRDLGGVIICDFIDMRMESHRREIERRLIHNLKQHKERAKLLRMSQFGIIEMTRQRQRASLMRSAYQDCRHCGGRGLVKSAESVVLDVMRMIQLAITREHIRNIELTVSSEVGLLLQNRKRGALHALEMEHRRAIAVRPDASFGLDQVQIHCYDQRGRVVPHT